MKYNKLSIFVFISITIAIFVAMQYFPYKTTNISSANDFSKPIIYSDNIKIKYRDTENQFNLPSSFKLAKDESLSLFLDVSKVENLNEQSLYIISSYYQISVYRGEELIYNYKPEIILNLKNEGSQIHFVDLKNTTLSENSNNEELRIEYKSANENRDSKLIIKPIKLGNRISLINNCIKKDFSKIVIGIALILIFLILLLIHFIILDKKAKDNKVFHLALLSLFIGLYLLEQTNIKNYYFPYTAFMYIFEYFNFAFLPIPVMYITETYVEDKYKIVFKSLRFILAFNLFCQATLLLTGMYEPRDLLFVTHIIMFAVCFAVLSSLFMTDYKNYPSRLELFISMLPLAILFVAGLVSYVFTLALSFVEFLMFGALTFIFVQLLYVIKKYIEFTQKITLDDFYKTMALRDSLTGVGSRMAYNQELEWLEKNHKSIDNISIISYDINGLKHVNDTLGHLEGDKMLSYFGTCLKEVSEKYNATSFRIGGDEFLSFLLNSTEYNAFELIEELNRKISTYDNSDVKIHFASGVEFVDCSHNNINFTEKLNAADIKMYEEKNRMKSRVSL